MDGFLIKPVSPSVMFDTIMQAFGKDAPRQLQTADEKKLEAAASKRLAGASVLLVEDNEINQQVAMEILSGAGLKVTVANNGQEALDLVRANAFDAVLMDVQMPVMDGYTATRKIRELEAGSSKLEAKKPGIAHHRHDRSRDGGGSREEHRGRDERPCHQAHRPGAAVRHPGEMDRPPGGGAKAGRGFSAPTGPPGQGPAPPEQTLPDVLPEFDLAEGLQRLMGNRALYRKLLVNFATQYANAAADIRSALDAADFDHAHGLVHAIKGVAGNLAAKDLQAQSVPLEKLVKHADPANPPPAGEVNPAYQAFREALGRALEAAGSLMPAAGVPPAGAEKAPGALPPDLAREAAHRLREAAEMGDVSGLTAVCSELAAKSDAFAAHQTRIIRLADDFDFDGILKLADELEKIR